MKREARTLLRRLESQPESPAYRLVKKLLLAPGVTVKASPSNGQPAEEALSIWLMRFQNATLRGRRFTGLAALLRALHELPADVRITQNGVIEGLTTAVLFFRADTEEPIGAVISVRTEKDVARSRANYERAMGLHVADEIAA